MDSVTLNTAPMGNSRNCAIFNKTHMKWMLRLNVLLEIATAFLQLLVCQTFFLSKRMSKRTKRTSEQMIGRSLE